MEKEKEESLSFSQQLSEKTPLSLLAFILFFLLIGLIPLYFISPLNFVDDLSVSGNEELPDQAILDLSPVRPGQSVFRVRLNKAEMEEAFSKRHPQIRGIVYDFSNWNNVIIQVDEYQTETYLVKDGQYYRVLENGDIVDEPIQTSIGNQAVISNFTEGDTLKRLIEEYNKVDENIKPLISEIKLVQDENMGNLLHIYMNDGNSVIASIPSLAEKINYYPAMRESVGSIKGTFHLEAGAYFVPFESELDQKEDNEEGDNGAEDEESPDQAEIESQEIELE